MRVAWILPLVFGSCLAAEPGSAKLPWEPTGYQGFVESIEALVGPDAIDCGFHNLLDEKLTEAARAQAYRCVRDALKGNRPFKFGTLRIPVDSYGYEVLVRSPRGELWCVTFDL